jgi:peptidoglycan/xylan/chitin deacetylase (PgdA/CDA1 family)
MTMSATKSPRKEEAVAIDDAVPVFALSRPDDGRQSRLARMSGKLSRFMARNVATKKLTMCNDKPLVTFTFDDAPASACTAGAALLEQYQARGTFYISGAGCGLISPGGRLATAERLKVLCAAGHEIGCHTFSHSAVAAVGRETLAADLKRNQQFLQGIDSDIAIRNFAYPYGDLSFAAKRCVETHFDSCRSLLPGVNVGVVDLGALKSCELQNSSIGRQGIRDIIVDTAGKNGWLIFVCHDVDRQPSRFGVSPDLLEFALNAVTTARCRLVTIRGALQLLRGAALGPTSTSPR